MIDADGYRPNVGIIVTAGDGRLLWAKRIGEQAWQFPQGGIRRRESPRQALYRELEEELGLTRSQVEVLAVTRRWLHYDLPPHMIRRGRRPLCIGQKQKWFLLKLIAPDSDVRFDGSPKPEFDSWRWVDYWYPLKEIVEFKREVYRSALHEFSCLLQPAIALAEPEPEREQSAAHIDNHSR